MKPSDLLDRPIAFHRCLAELGGSVNAGLMLSQALYWAKRTKADNGWFWKTAEEWQEETYLTRTEQATARKQLKRLSCWQEDLRGVPAKLYYRIDFDELDKLLSQSKSLGILQPSLQDSSKLDNRNPENKIAGNLKTFLLSETTTETTSETTTESVVESSTAIIAKPHTQQTEDAVSIALTYFPTMGIWQQELIANADINHLALWRQTMQIWSDHKWSKGNIHGMIDKYQRLETQNIRDKEYHNGQNQQHRPIRESHNQRAARKTLALIAELTGQNSGDNNAYTKDSNLELPAPQ